MQNWKWYMAAAAILIVGFLTDNSTFSSIREAFAQEVADSDTARAKDGKTNTKPHFEQGTTAVKIVFSSKAKTLNTGNAKVDKPQTTSSEHSSTGDQTSHANESADKKPSLDGITDEEAKKLIPFPFSNALTIFKDNDRQSYKQFSDTLESDDWDIKMQGQLVDAIYSHPNSNALTIDSILCKAHICELRLFATDTTTWPLIITHMKLQPWWDFGSNLSMYEFGIKQESHIKTVYFILLARRQ